jgi:hypothetical protein
MEFYRDVTVLARAARRDRPRDAGGRDGTAGSARMGPDRSGLAPAARESSGAREATAEVPDGGRSGMAEPEGEEDGPDTPYVPS